MAVGERPLSFCTWAYLGILFGNHSVVGCTAILARILRKSAGRQVGSGRNTPTTRAWREQHPGPSQYLETLLPKRPAARDLLHTPVEHVELGIQFLGTKRFTKDPLLRGLPRGALNPPVSLWKELLLRFRPGLSTDP